MLEINLQSGVSMEIIAAWVFFAILTALLAGRFGRSGFGWFCLALIISPLFAALLLICLPSKAEPPVVRVINEPSALPAASTPRAQERPPQTKKCPDCAELVQVEARICRYCRHEFAPPTSAETAGEAASAVALEVAVAAPQAPKNLTCWKCYQVNAPEAERCQRCGSTNLHPPLR